MFGDRSSDADLPDAGPCDDLPDGLPAADLPDDPPEDADEPAGADLARRALRQAQSMARGGAPDEISAQGAQQQRVQRRRRRNRTANLGRREWSAAGADDRDPQPLASVFSALTNERGWRKPLAEARVFSDWAGLVGDEVAANCTPVALRDGDLRISARSSAWATQIRLLAPTLLARLATQLGAGVVTGVTVAGPQAPSWKHGRRSVPGARGPRDTYG